MEVEDMEKPVIKYDAVYTPNPAILKHIKPYKTFSSFEDMMKVCKSWLEQEEAKADKKHAQFTPYKCKYVLKPEFRTPDYTEDSDI